ncbi:MAG: hypothetical protein JRK53_26345 [Deltaproteobacteria bacterium]|nr:hypothetical protein [Deltaproteobacteria bacterium]
MAEGSRDSGRTWERGWEGHERAQLLRMSRLSFAEKIQWLEEAQQFVEELKFQKKSRKSKPALSA